MRWVAVMYWTVWTVSAVLVAAPLATATWIMQGHVALLTAVALPLMFACAVASLVLMLRSYRDVGRPRTRRLLLWAAPILVAAPSALAAWAVYPPCLRLARARFLSSVGTDDWGPLRELVATGVNGLETSLAASWLGLTCAIVLAGLVWAKLRRHRTAPEKGPRRRLAATLLLSALVPAVMLFGGFELCRRAGLVGVIVFRGDTIEAAVRECLEKSPEARDHVLTTDWRSDEAWNQAQRASSIYSNRPPAEPDPAYFRSSGSGPFELAWIVCFRHEAGTGREAPNRERRAYLWLGCRHGQSRSMSIMHDINLPSTYLAVAAFEDRRILFVPADARLLPPGTRLRPNVSGSMDVESRPVWGPWRETGPTLTFDWPWSQGGE